MSKRPSSQFCGRTRREFLWQAGGGFAALPLVSMLGGDGFFTSAAADEGTPELINPLAPKEPHFPGKAKSVIFLFMYGGPSHIDTFDYKPTMYGMDGQTVDVKTFGRGGKRNQGRIVEPRWKFKQYGESGKWVSDLFPNLGTCVDDIAFLHSMTADSPIHGSAMLMMNSGKVLSGSPSLGSWITYGLGSENENLPGYVVMLDRTGGPISGAKNWSSGYMPASYQGVVMRSNGAPILDLNPPEGMTRQTQRRILDRLLERNHAHQEPRENNTDLAARIASYELAYKMQATAPEAIDVASEPEHVKSLYGMDNGRTEDFGRKCLLARRLAERGVRFIQLYHPEWDHHGGLPGGLRKQCRETDQAAAALIADLKQRGLLQDTLVVWGGEFGRTNYCQGKLAGSNFGRDHHPRCFTMWLAGGGVRGGLAHGRTDPFSYNIEEDPVHIHDFQATLLHLLGINHERLTFRYQGRAFRLTDVHGHVVDKILA